MGTETVEKDQLVEGEAEREEEEIMEGNLRIVTACTQLKLILSIVRIKLTTHVRVKFLGVAITLLNITITVSIKCHQMLVLSTCPLNLLTSHLLHTLQHRILHSKR